MELTRCISKLGEKLFYDIGTRPHQSLVDHVRPICGGQNCDVLKKTRQSHYRVKMKLFHPINGLVVGRKMKCFDLLGHAVKVG